MGEMHDKVAIITDSIACLPPQIIKKYAINVVPINIHFNGKIYHDGVDLSIKEAYHLLEKDARNFASSPASIGEYIKVYKEVAEETKKILVITTSTKLSTMLNVANLARENLKEELSQTEIEIINSKTATVGEGLVVTEAARAAESGKSLDEVVRIASDISNKVIVEGVLSTIRYVYRTGRIPKFPARLGSYFNIKPIFFLSDGKVNVAGISRNTKKGIDMMFKDMQKAIGKYPVHVAVAHADAYREGIQLKERLESNFNCVESWLTDVSPVIAYATGAGALIVGYYVDKTDGNK